MSERVVEAIKEFIPSIEVYSIDEVFMDLDHVDPDHMEEFLFEVRKKVKDWTGIPISIGAAPTKTLAKVANKIAKESDGVYYLANPNKEMNTRTIYFFILIVFIMRR
jgi:DNA polymerase V